ncbi:MAG TPA: SufBD protein [Clostridia bacterium]|nr:SufBD protein [Clostridia bacterium]
MNHFEQMAKVYADAGGQPEVFKDSDVAHLVISGNKVLGAHLVPGLCVDPRETEDGVAVKIVVEEGAKIARPIHMCFGVVPEEGLQKIDMHVEVLDGASASVSAHCVFPNAVKVTHVMDAEIILGKGAEYKYNETHFHGMNGGVKVVPKTKIIMGEYSYFYTEFNLPRGRAGYVDIDYDAELDAHATVEMITKVNGYGDDLIKIREAGTLKGENSRGVLKSRIALKGNAVGDVYNEMIALGAKSRGHVDCTEIIMENARAKAVPVVDVRHPEAQVTHEAAIGGVNRTQLETLMARGLDEEEATEMIVQGLLQG